MPSAWWLPDLRPTLSQGDVLSEAVVVDTTRHEELLTRIRERQREFWVATPSFEPDQQGFASARARCRMVQLLVISHNCELDKARPDRRSAVLIAPIRPLSLVPPDVQDAIRAQRRFSSIPVLGLPGSEDSFADLRLIAPMDRATVDATKRVASMSDAAVENLRLRIVHFFARKEDADDEDTLPTSGPTTPE
jgi:hypothetical protein